MTNEILMPELSPTMTSGILSRWLVKVGDSIKPGDIVAEIETDKVTVEFEADKSGVVEALLVAEGTEDVAVGASIIALATIGETLEKVESGEAVEKKSPAVEVVKADAEVASKADEVIHKKNSVAVEEAAAVKEETSVDKLVREIKSDMRISPIARRMAYQAGLDIAAVKGTGEKGRINKQDIRNALGLKDKVIATHTQKLVADYQFEAVYELLPEYQEMPLTGMRKTVADRLAKSSQYIPHFYMSVDCTLDPLLALRKQINSADDSLKKLTVNDFVVKSVALALKRTPDANVMWDNDKILQFSDVDISIAVSIEGGLITPVIKSCNTKGLRQISSECSELVDKAKAGRLAPNEFQGGTFTISNLGMFGIREFTSIINPPQAGILSVGAGEPRPVVINGEVVIKTQMTITLAMDHRCVDGVTGAKLINQIKQIIENPLELML